jgi:POT family proton-dependent oligopeptide transporter
MGLGDCAPLPGRAGAGNWNERPMPAAPACVVSSHARSWRGATTRRIVSVDDETAASAWHRRCACVTRYVENAVCMRALWQRLANAPRELWLIYVLKLLSSYAYFSLSLALVLFLSETLGYDDTNAGLLYGLYGVVTSLYGLASGWLIDRLGVRRSLLLGAGLGTVARAGMAVLTHRVAVALVLLTVLPFAECLGVPVLTICIKRYASGKDGVRTVAYSLFYTVMNVAALLAGPTVELCHRFLNLRLVFFACAVASAIMFVIVLWGVREIEIDHEGQARAFVSPFSGESVSESLRRLYADVRFWRLLVFTILIVGVRLIFRHLDATLPKYMTRVFGKDAPFGLFYAINPLIIITLVPLIGVYTRHIEHFQMILYGSFLSGFSVFWMLLGDRYWTVAAFITMLSLGEAVYSPRVYDYTMAIAVRGSEGTYTSLASLPLFGVQFVTGWMSGVLLQRYCPADPGSVRHPSTMWSLIGLATVWSPIGMWLFRDWLRGNGRVDKEPDHLETSPRHAVIFEEPVDDDLETIKEVSSAEEQEIR